MFLTVFFDCNMFFMPLKRFLSKYSGILCGSCCNNRHCTFNMALHRESPTN